MTIEFHCENCGKLLKTPDDKAGKTGKCPDCGEPVIVPMPEPSESPVESAFSFEESPPPNPYQFPPPDSDSTKNCPMCGAILSSRASTCDSCGEQFDESPSWTGEFSTGNRIDIGNVISTAWDRYQKQMGNAIGAMVIMMVISWGVAIVMQIALFVPVLGILVWFGGQLIQIWLALGICRVMLKIARGQESDIAEVFSGGPYFSRAVLAMIVIALIMIVVAGGGAAIVAVIAAALQGNDAMYVALAIAIPIVVITTMIFGMAFYWVYFLLVDIDPPGLSCISLSRELMAGNYLTVILTMLCAGIIAMSGIILCGVGMILTAPFAMVIIAVTYDHLAGGARRH